MSKDSLAIYQGGYCIGKTSAQRVSQGVGLQNLKIEHKIFLMSSPDVVLLQLLI